MNAAETIQAAIEKLTRLRDEATRKPWSVESMPETDECRVVRDFDRGQRYEEVVPGRMHAEDANLIVTLHATIDAQLAILHIGNALFYADFEKVTPPEVRRLALVLAKAILGEQVDA